MFQFFFGVWSLVLLKSYAEVLLKLVTVQCLEIDLLSILLKFTGLICFFLILWMLKLLMPLYLVSININLQLLWLAWRFQKLAAPTGLSQLSLL